MFDNVKNYLSLRKIAKKFKKPLKKVYSRKITKYNIKMVKMIYKNLAKRYSLSVKQLYNYLPLSVEIDDDMQLAYGLCETRIITKKKWFKSPIKVRIAIIYLNGKDLTTTTFIHEFGHYLRFLIAFVAINRNVKAFHDFRRIVDLVRSRSDAYSKKYDHFFTRGSFTEEEEENFAKSWELYLRNGISPSKKYQKLFNDFRKYIFDDMYKRNERRKYEYYEDLQVKITPERKKFFDELLIGKRFKKDSIFIKILELYTYILILLIIYKLLEKFANYLNINISILHH